MESGEKSLHSCDHWSPLKAAEEEEKRRKKGSVRGMGGGIPCGGVFLEKGVQRCSGGANSKTNPLQQGLQPNNLADFHVQIPALGLLYRMIMGVGWRYLDC